MSLSGVISGIFYQNTVNSFEYIFNDTNAKIIFVGNSMLVDVFLSIKHKFKMIIQLNGELEDKHKLTDNLLSVGLLN